MIDFEGEKVEIMELSRRYGVPWSTINNRYLSGYRDGDLVVPRIHDTNFKGKETTLVRIAKEHGLPLTLIKTRHAAGLRDDALVVKYHRGKGTENAATKLDHQKVREIKVLLWTSDLNQTQIANLYGVDPSHISDIKRRKRWAKVKVDIKSILE